MRFFSVRSLALATLVPALGLFVLVPGCAKQSEGERCGDTFGPSNNDDCGDNLTCTTISHSNGLYRCCYTDGHITDSRCEPQTSTDSGSGGASAAGGASGGSSGGGDQSNQAEAGAGGS
jgi:uncharacterized membrane protein YgcG